MWRKYSTDTGREKEFRIGEEKAGCWRGELMLIEKGKGRERKTKWKKEVPR